MQDWLYEEGEDESKGVYEAKLKELQALGEPLLHRSREAEARPAAASALASTANRLIAVATASDAKHAHIPQEDKDKVHHPTPRQKLHWVVLNASTVILNIVNSSQLTWCAQVICTTCILDM